MNPPSIEFDVYLNDLTQFQVIDQKSLVNAFKFKYENGVFYVRLINIININFDHQFLRLFFKCFMGEHLISINPGKQLQLYADNVTF